MFRHCLNYFLWEASILSFWFFRNPFGAILHYDILRIHIVEGNIISRANKSIFPDFFVLFQRKTNQLFSFVDFGCLIQQSSQLFYIGFDIWVYTISVMGSSTIKFYLASTLFTFSTMVSGFSSFSHMKSRSSAYTRYEGKVGGSFTA